MDAWNPSQYNRFTPERSQPFWDLVAHVADVEGSMLDIGCGTGDLTAQFHEKRMEKGFAGETLGIDSSAQMLAKAPSGPGMFFERDSIEKFEPGRTFDLVISNAALQWVDNHKDLFPRIWKWTGKALAVQMPCNFDHYSHVLAENIAGEFGMSIRHIPVLAPEHYARMMYKLGARDVNVFMKVYLHRMRSGSEVVEWTKGTLLTFYEQQLSSVRFQEFVNEYSKRMIANIGDKGYLYTFKRLFIVAKRPA